MTENRQNSPPPEERGTPQGVPVSLALTAREPGPARTLSSPGAPALDNRGWRQRLAQTFDRLVEHRLLILASACGWAIAGFLAGYAGVRSTALVRLAIEAPSLPASSRAGGDSSRIPPLFATRLGDEFQSPAFLARLVALVSPTNRLEHSRWVESISLDPQTGLLTIKLSGRSREMTVRSADQVAGIVLARARELWQEDLRQQVGLLARQMEAVEAAIGHAKSELSALQRTADVLDSGREFAEAIEKRAALDSRISTLRAQLDANTIKARLLAEEARKQTPALVATREALQQALARYTEEHPKVKALRLALAQLETEPASSISSAEIDLSAGARAPASAFQMQLIELRIQSAALEKEWESLTAARDDLARRLRDLSGKDPEFTRLNAKYQALKESRESLLRQQNELLLVESRGPAVNRLLQPAFVAALAVPEKLASGARWAARGGLAGGAAPVLLILLLGSGRHIRSRRDLERATGLPVLACLGNLNMMNQDARERWAFETLSVLKANLRDSSSQALICGFLSSGPREGRTTWVNLLAAAASRQGYGVIIASHQDGTTAPAASAPESATETSACETPVCPGLVPAVRRAELPGRLLADLGIAPVRIGLAEWIWNWQYREEFEQALRNWRMIENLAVFVEMPPYSTPAGVMMSEKVPNLVWLSGCNLADAPTTQSQVAALRRSRASLAGAVLNHPALSRRHSPSGRAAAMILAVCALLWSGGLLAQDAAAPPEVRKTPPALSVVSPDQMADWQRRLTLGPGDALDVSLYGQPDSARLGLVVGPDGRITFLQARDIVASGLTVDELRAELEKALAKYVLAPKVVINPVAYRSKKYYLLGNVLQRGVFALDRPTTIIEAVAKGRGFASTIQQQNVVPLVDLDHSFLIRKCAAGEFARLPVDFDALFLRGDLSHNIALAPDDYLFFPAAGPQEVYVVGAVRAAGTIPYTKDLTALGAIAARGGFADDAWKSRVLVVRGSLARPEPIMVNVDDILHARGTDLKLANHDIVYVNKKPWAKPQDLVERASMAFVSSLMMGYVNQYIIPYRSYTPAP